MIDTKIVDGVAVLRVVLEGRAEDPPGGGAAALDDTVAQTGEEAPDHRAEAPAVHELHGEGGISVGHGDK